MNTPIECLEKEIKVFEKVKYQILSEKVELILREQKTEKEIDLLILKIENSITHYQNAINLLSNV